jgi:hypothetical protein
MRERGSPRLVPPAAAERPTLDLAALFKVLEPALDAIAEAIGDRVAERQAQQAGTRRPHLLDRRELAAHLGVCVDVVDRLRREGCPDLMVGDSVRFELDRVLEWLRVRK